MNAYHNSNGTVGPRVSIMRLRKSGPHWNQTRSDQALNTVPVAVGTAVIDMTK